MATSDRLIIKEGRLIIRPLYITNAEGIRVRLLHDNIYLREKKSC